MSHRPDASADVLNAPLREGDVRLEPLAETDREPLRRACARDDAVWAIYPVNLSGDDFDRNFVAILAAPGRLPFAIWAAGALVGTTSYLSPSPGDRTVEIGGTYIAPSARGGRVNGAIKRLMIDHAFACGYARIEFRVDTRNARSMAAVARLGATLEGVLRRNRVTWTGFARDTAVYALLAEEWPAR